MPHQTAEALPTPDDHAWQAYNDDFRPRTAFTAGGGPGRVYDADVISQSWPSWRQATSAAARILWPRTSATSIK